MKYLFLGPVVAIWRYEYICISMQIYKIVLNQADWCHCNILKGINILNLSLMKNIPLRSYGKLTLCHFHQLFPKMITGLPQYLNILSAIVSHSSFQCNTVLALEVMDIPSPGWFVLSQAFVILLLIRLFSSTLWVEALWASQRRQSSHNQSKI